MNAPLFVLILCLLCSQCLCLTAFFSKCGILFRETSLIDEHMHIPDIDFTSLWLCLWLILSDALVFLKTPHLHPDAIVNVGEEGYSILTEMSCVTTFSQ